ncbi:MAG TPA: trehalase family glycosidase [Candidatus Saccharimonadales bacterium]|nr:trehalase family glycosidase [Candidatus Saccharimonadales bacterium]
MSTNKQHLIEAAKSILAKNDRGDWTMPTSNGLYPHQWLWDTFFISMGQRHYDVKRAKQEVRSPFRAQWKNGMLPHIIFGKAKGYHAGPEMWCSEVSRQAPDHISTTGITQTPLAAEATVRIGAFLNAKERREWYKEMYPKIVAYHQWFYRERDPRGDGLIITVHPWENGMDNSPPQMEMLHKYAISKRLRLVKNLGLENFLKRFRKDTAVVPAEERISTLDLYAVYTLIQKLRRVKYDHAKILQSHPFQIIDLMLSCVLIRANEHLKMMADEIGETLPADIKKAMRVAPHALETLWDDETEQYYNRDAISGKLIKESSLLTFLPLYGLQLPKDRVEKLVAHLHNPDTFGAPYPVPSTPLNSSYFKPHCYWQGPSWMPTNWLVIQGLLHNGQKAEAHRISEATIAMVQKGGFHEYFSPIDMSKAGADTFSWTAALAIDLIKSDI